MDYMKLKLAIYESYGNGEMANEACSHLIDHLDEKYGESIAEEVVNAENEFIHASLNVFTEKAGEEVLIEAAKNFGEKVKAAWEKLKAWIKQLTEKIKKRIGLNRGKDKIKIHKDFSKTLNKTITDAKKIPSAKDKALLGAVIASVAADVAAIIKLRQSKQEKELIAVERDVAQKECAAALAEVEKLTSALDYLNAKYDEDTKALVKKNIELEAKNEELEKVQRQLKYLKDSQHAEDAATTSKIKWCETEISRLKKDVENIQSIAKKEYFKSKTQPVDFDVMKVIHSLLGSVSSMSNFIDYAESINRSLNKEVSDLNKARDNI